MIYLDNAATTKPNIEVLKCFEEINTEEYYNPSASYSVAFNLFKKINKIRKNFISYLQGDCDNDNVIFTSGATESNNIAILGSATNKTKTYLFSQGEHPAVYNCAMELLQKGYDVKFIPLQRNGQIDYSMFENMMNANVCFVSTMFVSNETGAINDLNKIRSIIDKHNKNAIFHVDAVQGFMKIKLNLKKAKVNLCSLSAHKIGGIKGVGALYISHNTHIKNINFGGEQEFGLRSGTVNYAGIMSFNKACEVDFPKIEENYNKVENLKKILLNNLKNLNKNNIVIVSTSESSPYVVSLLFENNRGETIMRYLDSCGICVGTGSACSSSKVGNRILESMGYTKKQILGAIRISFCEKNTEEEINTLTNKLNDYLNSINA